MPGAAWKASSGPDEKRVFGHGTVEFFGIGGGAVRRFTLLPGWRWSLDMGPAARSQWCEAWHFQYQVSGRMHVLTEDGTEFELGPGDISLLPAGHDTWVVGDEPVVLVDWYRASHFTRPQGAVPLGSDDVTAEKQALRVVIGASRLAATNTLAGGVAHNINNLMTVVVGHAAMLFASASGPQARESLAEIEKAANAASKLAEQLLAYSHGAVVQPGPVSLNEVVRRAVAAEGKTGARDGISVELDLDPALAPTQADSAQMDQLVRNLLTNAKEAITGTGSIVIRTSNVSPSREEAEAQHLSSRGSVRLSIRDSGCGMTPETAARVFEPFYSTKCTGRGLGLSAAYGIVTSHFGKISVESRVGAGSTFTVDLPALASTPSPASAPTSTASRAKFRTTSRVK